MRIVNNNRPWVLLLALAFAGCGTVTSVRAIRRGESAVAASFGGPVAHIAGMDMPFPYAVARYRYGLTDRIGLSAGGHLTAAALGVVGIDAGLSSQFTDQNGWVPAFSATAGLTAFVEPGGEEALFPGADVVASYLVARRYLVYFGSGAMFQLKESPYAVLAPLVGAEVRLGRGFSLGLETRWYGPGEKTKPRNVNYKIPIGGKGALGFVLGAGYSFGGWYE